MKRLIIFGMDGHILSDLLLDIEGENFATQFPLPMFLPVVGITMTDLDNKQNTNIRKTMARIKGLLK